MIQTYFQAERNGGFFALTIGLMACTIGAAIFLGAGAPFYTGLAIPLVLIGIVQVMVGTTIARRSDRQADDLEKLLRDSPKEFRDNEGTRMAAVLRSFAVYKWVEITFVTAGLIAMLLNPELNFTKGLGAGLFAQGAIMLVFDYFAEKRAKAYAAFVQSQ